MCSFLTVLIVGQRHVVKERHLDNEKCNLSQGVLIEIVEALIGCYNINIIVTPWHCALYTFCILPQVSHTVPGTMCYLYLSWKCFPPFLFHVIFLYFWSAGFWRCELSSASQQQEVIRQFLMPRGPSGRRTLFIRHTWLPVASP